MCGIIGIASTKKVSDISWLLSGSNAMQHRGPDGSGEWWDANQQVGFGHRRLAIIDLSIDGQQPMLDSKKELCIVFNGEIYNYLELRSELIYKGFVFKTQSDTEVILAAYREWGLDCLSRLNGMFAFAIYDMQTMEIFIARDRAGEKPLFYSLQQGELRFASELKGLMSDKGFERSLNYDALACYLAEGYVAGERCILEGVNKLPTAHALVFNLKNAEFKKWRYWDLPTIISSSKSAKINETALLDELESLLEDSVRRQLIADVPVGILLSGGLDSSLITAMAVRARSNIKTFTIRFPGHNKYDETEHARLIANHFSTEHHELEAQETSVELLSMLAKQFDEPLIDSSMIPTYLVSNLIKSTCKVALGGDGGDELFGGYNHYDKLLWLQQKANKLPLWSRRSISKMAEIILPVGYKGRNWLQAFGTNFNNDLPLIASYYDAGSRARLLKKSHSNIKTAEQIRKSRIPICDDLLQRSTRMDFENYLPEDILVKVDRASMLNSLEVRAPMLDYRLIEFAFGKVPSSLKTTSGSKKILLKKLASRILPPNFDQNRKQGFSIPLSSWLQSGPWLNYFSDVLLDKNQLLFDHKGIKNMIRNQKKGYNNGERLFGLVMFELWRNEYDIKI
jgi:asparagine synthase (glutamine-hydrolysing)